MDSRAPRLVSKYAASLTTIASKLAPTMEHSLVDGLCRLGDIEVISV
ncbi:UNVERIFIED_ORG: hypothetical protein J2Y84_004560 [Pseudomonas reinekei]|nr:hypothetical protein [Pseudomonas reinekei]